MYTIKKVSELVGIPTVTIRAWEKRYRVLAPTRSEGGHRLYTEQDIDILKWLKTQTEVNGFKISEAARKLHTEKSPVNLTDSQPVTHNERLSEELYSNLLNLNSLKANELIDLAFSLYSYRYVFHSLLAPLLTRIGNEWESGDVTVAQEHFATELMTQRFHQIFRILPIHPQLPKVLAFCPEGEHHHVGLMLFSLFLREKGMEVLYLGANTPYQGIQELAEQKQIVAMAISISHSKHLSGLLEWIQSFQHSNESTTFLLGGKGVSDAEVSHLPNVFKIQGENPDNWDQTPFLKKLIG